jgi:hypothetical protein
LKSVTASQQIHGITHMRSASSCKFVIPQMTKDSTSRTLLHNNKMIFILDTVFGTNLLCSKE